MTGYLFAFISSIFFSLYVIPRKLSKQSAVFFSLQMGVGFFVSSVILYLLKPLLGSQEPISLQLLWSILAGAIWATGFVAFIKSLPLCSVGLIFFTVIFIYSLVLGKEHGEGGEEDCCCCHNDHEIGESASGKE